MIHTYQDVMGRATADADAVVVGSGAGGAVAAARLRQAGKSVVLIEEGPYIRPEQFSTDLAAAARQLYRDQGERAMLGTMIIPTQQASVVGGTTVINNAVCFRLPDDVLDEWVQTERLEGLSPAVLAPYFDELEQFLSISDTPEPYLGRHNVLLRQACQTLGWEGEVIRRNVKDCKGCGVCMTGCGEGAKMSMDRTYVPAFIDAGGELFTDCRIEKITVEQGRAAGVAGVFIDPVTRRPSAKTLEVRAQAVIIACGAMGTPVLLQRNGLANSSGLVGRNLVNHTATGMLGFFEERVNAWRGVNFGYCCTKFRRDDFMIEAAWAPIDVIGIRVPGLGLSHKDLMARIGHVALWGAMIRARTQGRVIASRKSWSPTIIYNMDRPDAKVMQRSMKAVADLFFAAGAKFITPGINKIPSRMYHPRDTRLIMEADLKPTDFSPIGNHPAGTCRMSERPRCGVVNSRGESHDLPGLFIADASIFPTAPGVNPQETIMALAAFIADGIAPTI
jgi:choline dehydrogenase-like flavoprotein